MPKSENTPRLFTDAVFSSHVIPHTSIDGHNEVYDVQLLHDTIPTRWQHNYIQSLSPRIGLNSYLNFGDQPG